MIASRFIKKKLITASFYFFILTTNYALPNDLLNNTILNNSMTKEFTLPSQFSELERQVAAKMALDIRYFCSEIPNKKLHLNKHCLQPVTKLPKVLADVLTTSGIGSVILFAENLVSTEQIIQLTHDLQQAAVQSQSGQPLIISIDQEGGRVVRLPHATSFAGNMAIGATYLAHGTKFAIDSSAVIAKELKALGINNNYAPVVDINTNANNPVINTRSFSEDPQQVAVLGVAVVDSFQQHGLMATLKHFPGHGDTHVDSHIGLPLVEHDLATIQKQDLVPFQWAIKHSKPAMIMTAHIQYPALDDSTIENITGDKTIRPATMSRKILTDLLRGEMGFDGIIATDALDMAGIAHYFDEVTAVVETFVAGADLAVMPFKIRMSEDIDKFYLFIKAVAQSLQQKIDQGEFSSRELSQSLTRINRYKIKYIKLPETSVAHQVTVAEQIIAQTEHIALEQSLADNAVVLLTNKQNSLPIEKVKVERIHLFVLNWTEFRALKYAITTQWQKTGKAVPKISATVASEGDVHAQLISGNKLAKADLLIATIDTKIASVVDIGGAEDLLTKATAKHEQDKVSYGQLLNKQLQQAEIQKTPRILIAKGSPYLLQPYVKLTSAILVTFDDHIYQNSSAQPDKRQAYSSGYNTSMAIILGNKKALGKLPVNLKFNYSLVKY